MSCKNEESPPLTPSEALKSFVLADSDLQMELVAAEPLVQDPVAIAFDGAGRLWVVEMLGFMTDIDGKGEGDRIGRVSVLTDTDGDGLMDKGHIFLDSLVLPRALALVKGGILVSENIPLWFAADTDGDLRADGTFLVDSTYGGSGMPEHSANGLWHGMDNWLYNAKSDYRYRWKDGKWEKDTTEFRGQWGIAHDDAGRLFYNYNWSQLHADLVPPNTLLQNRHHTPSSGIDHGLTLEREIFPIRTNTAVNRGYVPGTLDENGRLLEFASACGPLIYRGNALPDAYKGNAFVCEPTANLIKRNRILEEGFMLSAEGIYKNREFLASTDERFRPISLASGPDGALYVVDMYKGIIQHGPYMTEYLREESLKRKLDRPIHMGRIWRITSKGKEKTPLPDMSQADSKSLVMLLGDPNGWTRDTAQRLLVERGDTSIQLELERMVIGGNAFGQRHALWTLEGLGVLNPSICTGALQGKDPVVAQIALRLLAAMDSDGFDFKTTIGPFITAMYDNAAPLLQMQMVLVSPKIDRTIAFDISRKFLIAYGHLPVARDVVMSSLEDRESMFLRYLLKLPEWTTYDQNREIFVEMLSSAIANKGDTDAILETLSIAKRFQDGQNQWLGTALLNGMTNAQGSSETGEIVLNQKPSLVDQMLLPEQLQKKLTWPGKPVSEVVDSIPIPEIDRVVFALGRQKYLNLCANCHGTQGEGMRRFAPPLQNSEWVLGEDYTLAMLLLHGLEGAINVAGKRYDIPEILPSMPSFSNLQNEDIAAIATYIRNSWGHRAAPVSSRTIGHIRFRTQGQIAPWKVAELDTLVFDPDL